MSNEDGAFFGGVIVGGLIVTFAYCIIVSDKKSNWEKEAIKANVAEYYLDSNYDKQFRFITNR